MENPAAIGIETGATTAPVNDPADGLVSQADDSGTVNGEQ